MAHAYRIFRIFVSSTFTDLQDERNALQSEVFPALKKFCAENGCQFQAIDLRWGIGEEASLDQRTMRICLEELSRCQRTSPKPNFILLLGDRYGWRPLPEVIPAREFEQIFELVPNDGERNLLATWYKRDDNAVPPVYELQPRTGEFVDISVWEKVERKIRSSLIRVVNKLNIDPGELVKYTASATEQEIINGALSVESAREHVFCFFRTVEDLPRDRSADDFVDMQDNGKPDPEARELINDLKERLADHLPAKNIHKYLAKWTGTGITTGHIEQMCKDVARSLKKVIQSEIEHIKAKPYLEKEIEDHESFGNEKSRFFVGRSSMLKNISEYLLGANPHPLGIYGEGGSGKSALTAFALVQACREHPREEIIYRFIGVTPNSSDGRALLEDLCRQISLSYGQASALPTSYEELAEEFPKHLALATADHPLILFLDALDQLTSAHNAHSLAWLPEKLPEFVRLVVTTRPGEFLVPLKHKLPEDNLIELGPMSLEEGEVLLNYWLREAGRTLQDFQRREIIEKFSNCSWPIYLKLTFEEARLWKSYSEEIALSRGKEGIIVDNLFKRLEADHGKMLISRSLGYITATREMNGLAEDELLDILSADKEFLSDFQSRAKHDLPEPRLPVAVWALLYFDMEPYLTGKSHEGITLLTFFHREMGEVARGKYLAQTEINYHKALADYFLSKADPEVDPGKSERKRTWKGNPRALSELPYHLCCAERWDDLFETLVDFQFLEQKGARVGVQESIDAEGNKTFSYKGVLALARDYDQALSIYPNE